MDRPFNWARHAPGGYEVSSRGDRRFSALFARLSDGRSIEEAYQLDVKGYRSDGNDWRLGKGKPPKSALTPEQLWQGYKGLWRRFLDEHPALEVDLRALACSRVLTDMFATTEISQARALAELLNERAPAPEPGPEPLEPAPVGAPRFSQDQIRALLPHQVFVFGSNTEGRHGKGAAQTALKLFGAVYGQAEGPQGRSYGIVTKDLSRGPRSIPLEEIGRGIDRFLEYAASRPDLEFLVTRFGSSLAGYTVEEMAGLFQVRAVPNNVLLPQVYALPPERAIPACREVAVLDMQPDNIEKIRQGCKTATSRTYPVSRGVYALPDGTRIVVQRDTSPVWFCDLRDPEAYARAEGFASLDDMRQHAKFSATRQFLAGERPLHIAKFTLEAVPGPSLQELAAARLPQYASPTAQKHVPKELVKARIATQFIGEGSPGSSTDRYRQLYQELGAANTGRYSAADIVFVSSNGARRGRISPVENGVLQGRYRLIDVAMAAGASFVMDTEDHLRRTSGYNLGELALAEYVASRGYLRQGGTGLWRPRP